MAGFIPEETSLQWYRDNQLVPLDNNRVSVSYGDGTRLSSRGFTMLNKSVESLLTFTPPEHNDSGIYECRIAGYEFLSVQNIQLSVEKLTVETSKCSYNTS